jgi:S1-C subfamily serine protease
VATKARPKDFVVADHNRQHGRNGTKVSFSYEAEELGVEVSDLTSERAEELGYQGATGVAITRVDPDKAAAEQGLRDGMLILRVGKKTVKNIADFKAALKGESLKEGIVLLVREPRGNHFVVIKE